MDPNPVPGAVPAVAGIDAVPETAQKPVETAAVPAKPAEENPLAEKPAEEKVAEDKKDEPAAASETAAVSATEPAKLEEPPALAPPADAPAVNVSTADAPKPASVEDVPDKDGPVATTGIDEPKAIPSEQPPAAAAPATTAAPAAETVKESVEEPIAQEPTKEPVVEDEPVKEPVIEKPDVVNGAATKDVEMTGALNETEPTGSGEREAAPQAVPPEAKTGDKRKADDLEVANGANGTNGAAEDKLEEKPVDKKIKTGKPGRPPTNGAAKTSPKKDVVKESPSKDSPKKEKESVGHKVARNVKKVLSPVGKTARKTRSQGPA